MSTSAIGLLIAYFVKISKEGKRRDAVEDSFELKCPITAEESQQLANENNIKWVFGGSMKVVYPFSITSLAF